METIRNKQLSINHTFDAPIELVWEMWTQPEHLAQWWGPNGFTTTIHKMNVAQGEEWLLTMHGPDGKNYPNKSVFTEVIPFRKIVYDHFNPDFTATIIFEPEGAKTSILWTMEFDDAELMEAVLKAHNAKDGLKQNVEKLEKYLSLKTP